MVIVPVPWNSQGWAGNSLSPKENKILCFFQNIPQNSSKQTKLYESGQGLQEDGLSERQISYPLCFVLIKASAMGKLCVTVVAEMNVFTRRSISSKSDGRNKKKSLRRASGVSYDQNNKKATMTTRTIATIATLKIKSILDDHHQNKDYHCQETRRRYVPNVESERSNASFHKLSMKSELYTESIAAIYFAKG